MPFPLEVKTEAIVAAQRSCCICHKFCGVNIECHHIIPESEDGLNTIENCIPLCFDCHADVQHYNPSHPKGNKYNIDELRMHRARWFERVATSPAFVLDEGNLEVDRAVFSKIREILSDTGSMVFMREHDFGASYERKELRELQDFERWAKLPNSEFLNADLETLRSNLSQTVQHVLMDISVNTWAQDPPYDYLSGVPREERNFEHIFNERRDLLNTRSHAVYEAYVELIRTCRRRLAVN